jgi:hypothetical protein
MIGTLRRELLDKILILQGQHARRVLTEWLRHYAHGRPHRSLGQLTLEQAETTPPRPINLAEHRVRRRAILGRVTHEYWTRAAAWDPQTSGKSLVSLRIAFFEPHTQRARSSTSANAEVVSKTVSTPQNDMRRDHDGEQR